MRPLEGSFENITAWFIDIRKYTALSNLKSSQVVINFIKEYRELVESEFRKDTNDLKDKIYDIIYIGDAVLIILRGDNSDVLKKTVVCSRIIRDKMIKLLSKWALDDSYTGVPLEYFKKINFGIGISQGVVYIEEKDYIGSPLNHAAKIGDTRKLSKNNTHIGIDKDIFYKLSNNEIDKDEKYIGKPKDCEYIDLLLFEKTHGVIDDQR